MQQGEIRSLTGLRFVASAWVVAFHLTLVLLKHAPAGTVHIYPTVLNGSQGVDLFFIVSGYVLALNYTESMGRSWDLARTVRFWWLRLARVWPVYLVTLHLVIACLVARSAFDPAAEWWFDPLSYVKQLFMVQLWAAPRIDGTSWNDPSWSVSAEWLAYLLFPVFALVLWRLKWRAKARVLLPLAFLVAAPCGLIMHYTGTFYSDFSWLPRILCQFLAGALIYAMVSRLVLTKLMCQIAGWLGTGLAVLIVYFMIELRDQEIEWLPGAAVHVRILFIPLVAALAVGTTGLSRLLAVKPLVFGGKLSYSLYLVHLMIIDYVVWISAENSWIPATPSGMRWFVLGIVAACLALSYALWRFVEEPARKRMRAGWPRVARILSLDKRDRVPQTSEGRSEAPALAGGSPPVQLTAEGARDRVGASS